MQPGPSSAQGYADSLRDSIEAITDHAPEIQHHTDEELTDLQRQLLAQLIAAAAGVH